MFANVLSVLFLFYCSADRVMTAKAISRILVTRMPPQGYWHDSYRETDEMLGEWLQDCAKQVESVLQVGVELGAGFDCCYGNLQTVS